MRMILVMLAATVFAATASAQDAATASYDGTWAMSGTTADGRPINAELVLKGDGGTWRLYASGGLARKGNPCLMKEFPVDVQKSTADELTFHVDGTKVIAGCNEFTATLKPAGANALDGRTLAGGTLHIERK
jgi:hypothetical protein